MIEVEGLTKQYGRTVAVDDLSFRVEPGRVTGFLGPNGAGKSTTMRMMLDLDRPSAGRVLIDGRPYRSFTAPLRHVGALLEARSVHGGRRAHHHLRWLAHTSGVPSARVDEVLELAGLAGVRRKRVKGFSLGMHQRLALAAALLGDPPVLLLDEPVNGLDPEGIVWLRTLLKDLAARGRTVFVSSHLMSEMALTAEHLVVISRGRLLADTTVERFIAENSRSYVRIATPEPSRLREALAAEGIQVTDSGDGALAAAGADPARVGELVAAHGVVVHEIAVRSASLEEAFVRMTGDAS
ncbi:ABC transporter ATP-binding protein [Actinophytocola sp.]|uniref:ABC transporter ATP-binding protein n=1 Tax=Actinophytocola sp. TaxID=1872138 RepID=UPI002ED26051